MVDTLSNTMNHKIYLGECMFRPYVQFDNGLILQDDALWGGGVEIDDSVSSDTEFQIGCAIINKCTITVNNSGGDYNSIQFEGLKLTLYIKCGYVDEQFYDGMWVADETWESLPKGKFTVVSAQHSDRLITLECYDNMYLLDKAFSNDGITYPTTLSDIAAEAVSQCGLSSYFNNVTGTSIVVNSKPSAGATCRQVVSWVAQLLGCYARANIYGQIEFKWFDLSTSNTIDAIFNRSVSRKTYPITGVRGYIKKYNENIKIIYGEDSEEEEEEDEDEYPEIETVTDEELALLVEKDVDTAYKSIFRGSEGFVVEIKDNPLLDIANAERLVLDLYTKLGGTIIRKATVTHASNPTIEAGDLVYVESDRGELDERSDVYYTIRATAVRFNTSGAQTLISSGNDETASTTSTPSTSSATSTNNYISSSNRSTQIENQIAEPFSTGKAYQEGAYVNRNSVFYRCIAEGGVSAGDFNPSDWEKIVVCNELGGKNWIGSESEYEALETKLNDVIYFVYADE